MNVAVYPAYHLATRRYCRRLLEDLAARPPVNRHDAQRRCFDAVIRHFDAAGVPLPALRDKHGREYAHEAMLAQSMAEWWLSGRRIDRIAPELLAAFLRSDVSEVSLADVLPAGDGVGFLAFEPDPALTTPDHLRPLAGCFWHLVHPVSIRFLFVTTLPHASPLLRGTEAYMLLFRAHTFALGAQQAIDRALAEDIDELQRANEALHSAHPASLGASMTQASIDRHHAYRPLLARAMRVVINAFAFMRAFAEDRRTDFPADAPARLVRLARDPVPSVAKRNLSKLQTLGHFEQTTWGERAAHELAAERHRAGPRAHWRRGHWRNQAYGPQLSLRKLIWIRPTLVSADHDPRPEADPTRTGASAG